jgi:hypothetical protein
METLIDPFRIKTLCQKKVARSVERGTRSSLFFYLATIYSLTKEEFASSTVTLCLRIHKAYLILAWSLSYTSYMCLENNIARYEINVLII